VDLARLDAIRKRLVDLNARREIEHVGAPVTVDTDRFVDPDRLARELEVLFEQEPQVLALSCDLPAEGSWTTAELGTIPVLLTRDADGAVHAFRNACRHRGSPVAEGPGCGRRVSCPYHGWTYELDGRLSGVPDRTAFDDCVDGEALLPLSVDERHGFVVVSAGRPVDIDDYFGDLAPELAHFDLAELAPLAVHEATIAMNWKLGNDSGMEAYHVPYLHEGTVGPMTSYGYTYDNFGRHHRMGLIGTDAEGTEGLAGLTLVHHLFPNSMLVIGSGIVVHQRCEPRTPGTSHLRVSTYTWPGEATEQHRMLADFLWKVLYDEDCRLMAGAQRSFSSRSLERMVLGANEPGVAGLHRNWDAALLGD
jgi:carnitine monooxygenase subunit